MAKDIDLQPDVQTTQDTSRSLPQWLHDQVASAWSYQVNGMEKGFQDVSSLIKEGIDQASQVPWDTVRKESQMQTNPANGAQSILPGLLLEGVAGAVAGPIGASSAAMVEASINHSQSSTAR